MFEFSVDHYIDMFTATTDGEWCEGQFCDNVFVDGRFIERCCALGHCGQRATDAAAPDEAACLGRLLHSALGYSPVSINDGLCGLYRQSTPRARMLAALADVKAKQVAA